MRKEVLARTPMAGRGQPGLKCRICGKWKVSGSPCTCSEPDWESVEFDREPVVNVHPTVKPIALMRYLIRLVAPPNGLVIDPFLGSGTTLLACRLENVNGFGIEKEIEYEPLIKGRLSSIPPSLETFANE